MASVLPPSQPPSATTQVPPTSGGAHRQPACGTNSTLHTAAGKGDVQAVLHLLAHGANANARGHFKETPLHVAAMAGRGAAAVVSALLAAGAKVTARDTFGCTPLYHAAAKGNVEAIEALLVATKDGYLEESEYGGTAPAHAAAEGGHLEALQLLLCKGVNPQAQDAAGKSLLHYAAAHDQVPKLRPLLAAGVLDVNARDKGGATPLHTAAHHGFLASAQELLRAGAAITEDVLGCTPAVLASKTGHAQIAQLLAAAEAGQSSASRDDAAQEQGRMVLQAPLPKMSQQQQQQQQPQRTQQVLQDTAKQSCPKERAAAKSPALPAATPAARDLAQRSQQPPESGSTHALPSTAGNIQTVPPKAEAHGMQYHSSASAVPNANTVITGSASAAAGQSSHHHPTPSTLVEAAELGDLGAIQTLLAAGKNVNATDAFGDTAIHAAARAGQVAAIRLLVAAGAKVAEKMPANGFAPLHEAAAAGQAEAIQALLDLGAALDARNNYGSTALHEAAFMGSTPAIATLLAAGADPKALDYQGRVPLDLAAQAGDDEAAVAMLAAAVSPTARSGPAAAAAVPLAQPLPVVPPPAAAAAAPSAPPLPPALHWAVAPGPGPAAATVPELGTGAAAARAQVPAPLVPSPLLLPSRVVSSECVLCFDAQREIALIPCGHRSMCATCAQRFFKTSAQPRCPVCREKVMGSLRVFDP